METRTGHEPRFRQVPQTCHDVPDLKRILVIGSGPIVIGQACEFDYSGTQACKALRAEGLEVVLVNSNPATIMTDPDTADRTYVEPLTVEVLEQIIAREKPDALLPTVGGQTALNLAVELAEKGVLERHGVALIGASIAAIKVAEDRQQFKEAMRSIGIEVPDSACVGTLEDAMTAGARIGYPLIIRPVVHARRRRRRHRVQRRGVPRDLPARPVDEPRPRGSGGAVGHRLEGVRARGHARRRGQLRRHLLDREHRSDGRAHRRQHHRRAGADADRQGIPAHARRRAPDHPARRGRDGRIEHPVRDQSRGRPDGGDRDEPARVAVVGARLEGDRVPDRQDRGQAGARLPARRDQERHHADRRRPRSSRRSTTSS